ncbi:signal peptide peptidase SppA [Geotalea uraniireducens]|uniref:Signal peptide peptidase A, Serine peptidase, MEROPS family S49 n=1 Tax=Geotalea uraniireducens (strain Rf4) TaxID=351605 RepID=A5G3U7_GEOUR|nr:signal peptide peptidase SppA [Geotalea uraniireducens]ABQ26465.1 signal peptide peptidase A, Serine peptidase, MEROPS family S49 [Geotalea uraniireducens Rf4]
MKIKWLLFGLAVVMLIFIFFVASLYIATTITGEKTDFVGKEGIGLVEVKGIILDSQETVKQLFDFKKNENVKAVVLRIESPGGVVGPSQEIYDAVKKLALKKKVVVSMGSVAASGGYYIAAPATKIFANPGTITGSIGVLMKFSNIEGLMDKIGMKAFTIKTGKYKDVGSPVRTMSVEDKAMLQGVIDSTHGQFVKAVAEGRKLPLEQVKTLADGRIYSGEQALALKLVDNLGTMQDAIEEAGKLAGIKGEPHVITPPKKKKVLLDILMEETADRIGGLVKQENGLSVNYEMSGKLGQ